MDLDYLLQPRGVAVVGASADPARIGGQPVRALKDFGYEGAVYPVNPKRDDVMCLRCYHDVRDVPRPCDVAVIAVPAAAVADAIAACGDAGIPFAIVLSAGFAELGERGKAEEDRLRKAIAASGVRVIGPNCQGMLNLSDHVYAGFGAIFQNADLASGRIAMVTQSGGFGYAMVGIAEASGVGFNYVLSTGNEVDLTALDLIEHLLERDDVDAVATYLEGVEDGRRLVEIGRRAAELAKPIIVWKVGNSDRGREAAASHTANLTAGYELYQTAFEEGAFLEVRDLDDLVDVSRAISGRRLPNGPQVGVISISGGAGVLLADRLEELGLMLPPLQQDTLVRLREFVPAFSALLNPIDVTAQVFNDPDLFRRVLEVVLEDPGIDQALLYNASIQGEAAARLAEQICDIASRTSKPVLVGWSAPPGRAPEAMQTLEDHGVPWFSTPGRAAKGASALYELSRKSVPEANPPAVRTVSYADLELPSSVKALSEHASKACLTAYGIPVTREVLLSHADVRNLTAPPIPFPVVVKVESPDLLHKTEAGGVRTGVADLETLKEAADEVVANARKHAPDARIEGVSIQEMLVGTEVIVGAVNDRFFGPTVVFGLGGIFTETLRDVTRRFAPFDVATAHRMIDEIRASAVLHGSRGLPPLDVAALAETLTRLAWLVADHADRIAEVDINPLFVRPAGQGVVAADALVVLADANTEFQHGEPRPIPSSGM
jgi:acyl-CoA synthetase (NDP forming)